MKKNNLFPPALCALVIATVSPSVAFALPAINSSDNQTFSQNQPSTQLRDIVIQDDIQSAYIKKGELKITIPNEIKIIFDTKRTKEEFILFGSAIDKKRLPEKPAISFINKDKTLVIPIDADFLPGEQFTIVKLYVEGFHEQPSYSQKLYFEINEGPVKYLDSKDLFINISSTSDTFSPETPANIKVIDVDGGIKLTWSDPSDLDVQTIEILRGKNNSSPSADPFVIVAKQQEQYLDKAVNPGDIVKYILRASDGRNLSQNSEEISYTVGSTPVCTEQYEPVCGVDGKTYSNKCVATEINKVTVDYEGECKAEVEPEAEEPVEPEKAEINQPQTTPEEEIPSEKEEKVASIQFSDIETHWAKDSILYMANARVIEGNKDGTFDPDGYLNRAQAAALLYRIIDPEATPGKPGKKPFKDVFVQKWFTPYIYALKNLKLINGNPDGTFRPDNPVNRAEFLTMAINLYYYLASDLEKTEFDQLKAKEFTKAFADLEEKQWYAKTVIIASEKGFISGKICGAGKCFDAASSISRAEAATILEKMFKFHLGKI